MNESKNTVKLNLRLDYRVIVAVLLAIIVVMLVLWKPWQDSKATDRTIDVTGQATVSARPDEFVFYPTYEFKVVDRDAALKQLTAKNNQIIAGLKDRGVADKDIKTNSDTWSYPVYENIEASAHYVLRLTITTRTDAVAQKVQDYLVSTTSTGSISPQATFSEAKLKEVEAKGRNEAIKNARQKAEQSAENLGFKLSSVKTVNDGVGFGGVYPLSGRDLAVNDKSTPSLSIQPGENDLTYSVTVTYYIK